ncbi:relaxin receptor 2, partial [Aplysia californica]|uniref:Relaxin receptor 2 n=1 Tax=Aplysia californica TaxID=6500 RepID=A0ABM1A1P5_APLCA
MEDRGKGDSTNSRSSLSDRDDGVGSGSSFIRRKTKKAECAARRYYVIFSITMLVVAVIVVVVCVSRSPGTNGLESLIFNKCEYWAFPCASKDQCVNKTLVCDGTPHCRDGSDEDSVCDEYFNRFWEDSYNKRADGDREEASTDCSLDDVPSVCACRDKTKLYCDDRNLTRLPVSFPTKTSVLDLSGNVIDSLEGDQFHSLGNLELL